MENINMGESHELIVGIHNNYIEYIKFYYAPSLLKKNKVHSYVATTGLIINQRAIQLQFNDTNVLLNIINRATTTLSLTIIHNLNQSWNGLKETHQPSENNLCHNALVWEVPYNHKEVVIVIN